VETNLHLVPLNMASQLHLLTYFQPIPGIKEYSEWPTIPQLYIEKEFVGGCDILMSMHQNGELAKLLEEKGVLVAPEE
jgi:glutaredoxin-related protein